MTQEIRYTRTSNDDIFPFRTCVVQIETTALGKEIVVLSPEMMDLILHEAGYWREGEG